MTLTTIAEKEQKIRQLKTSLKTHYTDLRRLKNKLNFDNAAIGYQKMKLGAAGISLEDIEEEDKSVAMQQLEVERIPRTSPCPSDSDYNVFSASDSDTDCDFYN